MAEYMEYEWRIKTSHHDQTINYEKNSRQPIIDAVTSLRNLIDSCPDSELKDTLPQNEKILNKFVNARNLDPDQAFLLLTNYYEHRKKHPDIFKDFSLDAPDIRDCIENSLPGVLSSKDRKGRCVLFFTANNWDCTYSLTSIYRAMLLSLEYLLNDIHNQSNGFVIIVDWTEFTFRKTSNLKPAILKLMIEGLQDCFPALFKGIHFVGQSWYVEAALIVIKQFLNEDIKEQIYVHGNNLSTLHDYVHKDILPAELGGEKPSYNPQFWLKMMESNSTIL